MLALPAWEWVRVLCTCPVSGRSWGCSWEAGGRGARRFKLHRKRPRDASLRLLTLRLLRALHATTDAAVAGVASAEREARDAIPAILLGTALHSSSESMSGLLGSTLCTLMCCVLPPRPAGCWLLAAARCLLHASAAGCCTQPYAPGSHLSSMSPSSKNRPHSRAYHSNSEYGDCIRQGLAAAIGDGSCRGIRKSPTAAIGDYDRLTL